MSKTARRETEIFKDRTKLYALDALATKITDKYPDGVVDCPPEEEAFLMDYGQQMVDYLQEYGVHYSQTRMYRPAVKKKIISLRGSGRYSKLMRKYDVTDVTI